MPAASRGVADSLAAAGASCDDVDAQDWWWRCTVPDRPDADERLTIRFDGVTPPAEIHVDGVRVATVESMFEPLTISLPGPSELTVRCHAVGPWLAQPRRPRSRWRTKVADNSLRFLRTTLVGRAPGFAPGPPIVGLWRPAHAAVARLVSVDDARIRASLVGGDGRVTVRGDLRPLGSTQICSVEARVDGPNGVWRAELTGGPTWTGNVTVPSPQRWWPHTHGTPVLHEVTLVVTTTAGVHEWRCGRVGFRSLAAGPPGHDIDADGLDLRVNDVPVFVRGAVWTRPGGLAASVDLRAVLEQVRAAGMNMLRVAGTWVYETDEFHDLCDELGILVWQDAMLANFDYPETVEFLALLERETRRALDRLGGRPSFSVFCGGSEIEQQAAMMGRDPEVARGRILTEVLPESLRSSDTDAVWITGSPTGGALPFRNRYGVAHYFGVGGYRRPLSDVRSTAVRFASECLAISNVPGGETIDRMAMPAGELLDSPLWQAGTPQDRGADWNFGDVRDFYLREYYGIDPIALRQEDAGRYLELSAQVSGDVMSEVFGEWRRKDSPCRGGLILWLCDLLDGPGWGLFDRYGIAKPALGVLRRTLQPIAVWLTDEGLDGIRVHIANDCADEVVGRLRIALYRIDSVQVDGCESQLGLLPRSQWDEDVEALLGHFVDASLSYRFGPPGHCAVVAEFETPRGRHRAIRFPGGPAKQPLPVVTTGLMVSGLETRSSAETVQVMVRMSSDALLHGVTVAADGFDADDVGFFLEPHREHVVRLKGRSPDAVAGPITVRATNLAEPISVSVGTSG